MDLLEIVQKIKQKDQDALTALFERTKKAVFATAYAVIRDEQHAEDVTMDVYMSVVKNIHSFNEKKNFMTWIMTIAKNKAIDYVRKLDKEIVVDNQENEIVFVESEQVYDDHADLLLSVLDQEERLIVTLKIYEEMKHKEISKIVGKLLGTVLWIYNKAINKMKKKGREIRDE